MPTDANGVYSLPPGYLATDGDLIQASQHNPPLEDLASSMTGRMPRNGNAAMTGALQLVDGTVSAPGMTFASAIGTGIFKTANGFAITIGGVQVFEFTSIPAGRLVGEVIDFAGTLLTRPPGWVFCNGQSLLQASFPALFTVIGTTYGSADASHFNVPDLRGTTVAGVTTIGSTSDRGNLTGGAVFGALIGGETKVFSQANLPALTWPNSLGVGRTGGVSLSGTAGTTPVTDAAGAFYGGGGRGATTTLSISDTQAFSISGGVTSGGSGTPFNVVQPTVVMNKIMFAGA